MPCSAARAVNTALWRSSSTRGTVCSPMARSFLGALAGGVDGRIQSALIQIAPANLAEMELHFAWIACTHREPLRAQPAIPTRIYRIAALATSGSGKRNSAFAHHVSHQCRERGVRVIRFKLTHVRLHAINE